VADWSSSLGQAQLEVLFKARAIIFQQAGTPYQACRTSLGLLTRAHLAVAQVDFTAMLLVLQCNGSATQEAVWWDCIGPLTQMLPLSTVPLVLVSVMKPYGTLHSLWAMSQAVGLHITDNVVAYMQEVVRS